MSATPVSLRRRPRVKPCCLCFTAVCTNMSSSLYASLTRSRSFSCPDTETQSEPTTSPPSPPPPTEMRVSCSRTVHTTRRNTGHFLLPKPRSCSDDRFASISCSAQRQVSARKSLQGLCCALSNSDAVDLTGTRVDNLLSSFVEHLVELA